MESDRSKAFFCWSFTVLKLSQVQQHKRSTGTMCLSPFVVLTTCSMNLVMSQTKKSNLDPDI